MLQAARPRLTLGRALAGPLGASAAVHVVGVLALVAAGAGRAMVPPPMYRVDLVAAPAGERRIGVIRPEPQTSTPPATPPPPRAETRERDMPSPVPAPAPRRPSPPATPSQPAPARPTNVPAATAGGGPTGGRGTDVVTVRTNGIEFPFPGYLSNIVRQIALRFKPEQPNAPLRAEVFFLLHRDGQISELRVTAQSGDYAFDLDARGAIEAAANDRAFGPLPAGFRNDVLPVTFSFDPQLIR